MWNLEQIIWQCMAVQTTLFSFCCFEPFIFVLVLHWDADPGPPGREGPTAGGDSRYVESSVIYIRGSS